MKEIPLTQGKVSIVNVVLREALKKIYRSRATHCQGCKEHGQIAKAVLK
jgi:hypothetical protein